MYTELVEELMGLDNDSITERFRELELERRRIEAEMAAVVRWLMHAVSTAMTDTVRSRGGCGRTPIGPGST